MREFLDGGFAVLAVARDAGRLAAARAALGPGFLPLACDVRDAAGLRAGIGAAIARHGAPAWAVACAGVARPGRFLDLEAEHHEAAVAVNYLGALHLARATLPAMAAAGRGRLLLVSSAAALAGFYGLSAYAPSKAALRALGDVLALEMAPHGVGVTVAFPPDTDTPQLREEMEHRPAVTRAYLRGAPAMRPEAVARAMIRGAEAGRRHVAPGLGPSLLLRWPVLGDLVGRWRQGRLAAALDGPGVDRGGGG